MPFVTLISPLGTSLSVNPEAVCLVTDVPASVPPLAYVDLVDTSLSRLVIDGTAVSVVATLTASGVVAFATFLSLEGPIVQVNPALVSAVTPAPVAPPGSFLDLLDPSLSRVGVVGTVATVTAALRAGSLVLIHRATELFEDFLGAGGVTGTPFSASLSGGGALLGGLAWQESHPGVILHATGTTAAGRAVAFLQGSVPIRLGSDSLEVEYVARVPVLATVAHDFNVCLGVGNTLLSEPASGVYFAYLRSVSSEWLACTANVGIRTRTPTGVVVAPLVWARLGFEVNATNTAAEFRINGVLVATNTTNLPPGANTLFGPVQYLQKTAGAGAGASRELYVDYCYLRSLLTVAR